MCVLHSLGATECVTKWQNQQKKFWAQLCWYHQDLSVSRLDGMGWTMNGWNDQRSTLSTTSANKIWYISDCLHWDWWRKLKNCASFYGVVFLNYKLVSLGAFFMVPSCSFYSKWFPQETSCAGERRWCPSGRGILFWVCATSIFPPAYHKDHKYQKDNHHFISM